MQPIYTTTNVTPAYQLNWGLTIFWRHKAAPEELWLSSLMKQTEQDGVRILRHRLLPDQASQFFLSTRPEVSPSAMIRIVKAKLQCLIRSHQSAALQRNYSLRSIGSATREVVEDYVARQLNRHPMADERVQMELLKYQRAFPDVDLSQVMSSAHGRYWYNLHLVFVNAGRWMEIRPSLLHSMSSMIDRVSKKYAHRLSRLGMLADHIHLTLGCTITESPAEVALRFLNNLAFSVGMSPCFKFGYFAGTIGEYDRSAVL